MEGVFTFLLGGVFILLIVGLIYWSMADSSKCPHCKKYFAKSNQKEISREYKTRKEKYYSDKEKSMVHVHEEYDYVTYQFTCKHCHKVFEDAAEENKRVEKW